MGRRLVEGWLLWFILFFIAFCGDSNARKPCTNCRYDVRLTARFDFSKCWDTTMPKWKCNDVEFDPQELRADIK
jgi:hypothetical protein